MGANDDIAIAASFFSGLYVLQTLNFCWTGSFPTLMKFGIAPSKIGLFMGDTGASMNYWVSWGILLSYGLSFCGWTENKAFIAPVISTVIYSLAFAYTCYVKRFSGGVAFSLFILVLVPIIGGLFAIGAMDFLNGQYGKFVCPIVSCFTSICTFITNSIIFHVVVFGHGNEGVRKLYFWLCMSALSYQFDSCMTTKVGGGAVAWYFFAMELSYFVIPLIHWTCERTHKALGAHDLNFLTVFWHVFAICIFTLMALEMWIVNVYLNWGSYSSAYTGKSASASFVRGSSPFFMGIIGMGSIFWLFPVVWPFMVCHYSHFRFVMLLGPGLGSFATLIPWVLQDGDKIGLLGAAKTRFDVWNTYGSAKGYHGFWCAVALILMFFWISMCCIHYPRCFVARTVLHSRWAVVCGGLFFFLTQLIKAVGLTGCFANSIGPYFIADIYGEFKTSASISIDNGANVNFGNDFKFDQSKFTVSFGGRNLTATSNPSFAGTPTVILFGIVDVIRTKEFSGGSSGASGQFDGSGGQTTITLSGDLNLDLASPASGGPAALLIVSLTKIEIKNLALDTTSSQLQVTVGGSRQKTVANIDLTLVFANPVYATDSSGNRQFTLTGQTQLDTSACSVALYDNAGSTPIAGLTTTITAGGFNSTPATTVTIDASNKNVTLGQLTFSSLTITMAGGTVDQSKTTGRVATTQSTARVILYGTKADGNNVQTDQISGSAAASGTLAVNTENDSIKNITYEVNLNITSGTGKAGSFTSSSSDSDKLTKIVVSGLSINTSSLSIDGFTGKISSIPITELTFETPVPGGSSNFTIANKKVIATVPFFMESPVDFAHGPAFGNVSFSFSLFHLTGALFTSQAYSVGVGSFKCAVDSGCSWPTQGIGGFRSFCWWLCYGLKNGNRRFWSLADVDIIQVIS